MVQGKEAGQDLLSRGRPADIPHRPLPGVALFEWVKRELLDSISRGGSPRTAIHHPAGDSSSAWGVHHQAVRALNELVAAAWWCAAGAGHLRRRAPRPHPPAPGQSVAAYVSPVAAGGTWPTCSGRCWRRSAPARVRGSPSSTRKRRVARGAGAAPDGRRRARGASCCSPRDRSRRPGCGRAAAAGGGVVVVTAYFPGLPRLGDLRRFAVGYEGHAAMLDGATGAGQCVGESDSPACGTGSPATIGHCTDRGLPELRERSRCGLQPAGPGDPRQRLRAMLESPVGLTAVICGNAPTLERPSPTCWPWSPASRSVELARDGPVHAHDMSPLAVVSAGCPPTRWDGRRRGLTMNASRRRWPLRHVVLRAPFRWGIGGQNTLGVIGAGVPR